MPDTEVDFPTGLFGVALSPGRLYEFAHAFNAFSDKQDENHDAHIAMDKDHVRQAIEVADLLISKEMSKSRSLRHSIHRANHPMLALDAHGNTLEINEIARSLFPFTDKDTPFQNYFSNKTKNDLRSYLNRISVRNIDPGFQFIDLIELENAKTDQTYFVCLTPWKLDSDNYCLLIQAINIRWPDHMDGLLRNAFDLTSSEIEVFRLLSEGLSVTDTAAQRQTSVTTVRTQIREIYSKTGTKSQLQFIRLAVSLAALTLDENIDGSNLLDETGLNTAELPYPREEHWHLLSLPDGRNLDYAIFGDLSGTPCLFFHNELLGDIWPAELTKYATSQGLKIILPARPYYRRSSEYPKGVNHPKQTAKDFATLLDHLNIEKLPVLAQTLGGMFALEFAHLFEDRVESICTISPMLPFASDSQQTRMPPLHKFISSLLLKAPWMMEFVARAGFALYLKDGPEAFLRHTYSSASIDIETLEDPNHMKTLCRGLQFGEHNAHKPYVAGFKHLLKNSEEKMKNLSVPMSVIIGDADNNTRQERALSLIKSGADINIILAKDGGELLIFTHPEVIIDTLLGSPSTV